LRRIVPQLTHGKLDCETWANYWLPDAPQQTNGNDCGVFVCRTAEIVTRAGTVQFEVNNHWIRNTRCQMVLEVHSGNLIALPGAEEEGEEEE